MYKVNIDEKSVMSLKKTTYSSLQLSERYDIQEWIAEHPEVLGLNKLLIISKEYVLPSGIRLDLLALDEDANLIVIELKRDTSGRHVDLQAIKYASYCSAFTNEEIYEIFSEYLFKTGKKSEKNLEAATEEILQFINDDEQSLNEHQRLVLVAQNYTSDVIASVMWLRNYQIDISCIKLEPLLDTETEEIYLDSNIIIPTPEAEDYIIRKEKKEQSKQTSKKIFSLEKTNYSNDELKNWLMDDFSRDTELTYRLQVFFRILLEHDQPIGREQIKQVFFEKYNIGNDFGHAGRLLSNVSQFLTKPNSGHLRQIISFDSEGSSGKMKDGYYLLDKYRELVQEVFLEMEINL